MMQSKVSGGRLSASVRSPTSVASGLTGLAWRTSTRWTRPAVGASASEPVPVDVLATADLEHPTLDGTGRVAGLGTESREEALDVVAIQRQPSNEAVDACRAGSGGETIRTAPGREATGGAGAARGPAGSTGTASRTTSPRTPAPTGRSSRRGPYRPSRRPHGGDTAPSPDPSQSVNRSSTSSRSTGICSWIAQTRGDRLRLARAVVALAWFNRGRTGLRGDLRSGAAAVSVRCSRIRHSWRS